MSVRDSPFLADKAGLRSLSLEKNRDLSLFFFFFRIRATIVADRKY